MGRRRAVPGDCRTLLDYCQRAGLTRGLLRMRAPMQCVQHGAGRAACLVGALGRVGQCGPVRGHRLTVLHACPSRLDRLRWCTRHGAAHTRCSGAGAGASCSRESCRAPMAVSPIPGRRPHVAERRVSSSSRYYYYYYSSVVVFVVCLLYQPVPVCVWLSLWLLLAAAGRHAASPAYCPVQSTAHRPFHSIPFPRPLSCPLCPLLSIP